jgi:DNA-binding transcriptional LysR family regulator
MFDLIDLRLFCEVADAGSITHGAARAGLALAAASTRIRNLELAVGAQLLIRSRRGVTPTDAGRTFLRHARAMRDEAARLAEDMGAYAKGLAGEVRLLANTNASTEFLPEALSRFLAAHPHVSIDLEERLSDEIVGLVAEGAADIGIAAATVGFGTLQTFPFARDRFVVVAAPNHALAASDEVRFADILAADAVGLDRASALERFLADKAALHGAVRRLRVQMRSFDAVCRLAAYGVGLGVVPETTARRAAAAMPLAVIALADDWAARELTLCVRDLEALRPTARQLAEHLLRPPAGREG